MTHRGPFQPRPFCETRGTAHSVVHVKQPGVQSLTQPALSCCQAHPLERTCDNWGD